MEAFADRPPDIPVGNLDPIVLAHFIVDDFKAAWDAMATCSHEPTVGGNFMFARQAFAYLELASRTASNAGDSFYLDRFAGYLADRDPRYFTELPGAVPLPRSDDFRLPAVPGVAPDRQLLAALFDMSRHGLAHLYQQTPVDLTDGKQWQTTFTGVGRGDLMRYAGTSARRRTHLSYRVGPREGRVYLIIAPDVLLADLEFGARAAAIFSQYLAPRYLARPRPATKRSARDRVPQPAPYAFTSQSLIETLDRRGFPHLEWPVEA
jgi:hypothetical protein